MHFIENKALSHKYNDLLRIKCNLQLQSKLNSNEHENNISNQSNKLKQLKYNLIEEDLYLKKIDEAIDDQEATISELELALGNMRLKKVKRQNRMVRHRTEQDLRQEEIWGRRMSERPSRQDYHLKGIGSPSKSSHDMHLKQKLPPLHKKATE